MKDYTDNSQGYNKKTEVLIECNNDVGQAITSHNDIRYKHFTTEMK